MGCATGFYINVYGNGVDVFVIINEANDEPTSTEVAKIEEMVEDAIENNLPLCKNRTEFIQSTLDWISGSGLNCVEYGIQILMQDLNG